MPVVKNVTTRPSLAELQSLDDHPTVRPLAQRLRACRSRLQVLIDEIHVRRQRFYLMEGGFSRAVTPELVAMQEEEAQLESEIAAIIPELEAQRNAVRAELRHALQPEALAVLTSFREALQGLQASWQNLEAMDRRARRLGCGPTIPPGLTGYGLKQQIEQTAKQVERVTRWSDEPDGRQGARYGAGDKEKSIAGEPA